MARWSRSQVEAAATDAGSLAAAWRLARPGPWSGCGANDTLLWGHCQGSGATPYQVSIDLTTPAWRCSCPSRRSPCKHALALLLLWSDGALEPGGALETGDAPAEAAEWSARRAARAAQPVSAPPDPAAQAARLEKRLALMDAGIEELALWLTDLVRTGLGAARSRPTGWWDQIGARMVDAQLPGLGQRLRDLGSEVSARPDWTEHLLAAVGRLWAVVRAWRRREQLDADQLGDLRAVVGWSFSREEVRQREILLDDWLVLGAHRSDDGRLQQQRTWLHGRRTGETVQLLDFAAGTSALPLPQVSGTSLTAGLARYPGHPPRRALFVDEPRPAEVAAPWPAAVTTTEAVERRDALLVDQPWLRVVPAHLRSVRLALAPAPLLVDADGRGLPLAEDADVWALAALTGGHPADVVVELQGARVRPLTVTRADPAAGLAPGAVVVA
ncbi:SWIM zinc finger family protein [Desertihabitans brevis]|uniref:SWIM zinc finger family protein n=1 Tax=Desertihabitans brevis TaxID=2268447 RepID=UPI0018F5844D|nr:SWIM zinc finger family protein [Desertihabitans brevis]